MKKELDLMYAYHLRTTQMEKNQYLGGKLQNVDIKSSLPIFLDFDPVNQQAQQFVFATVVYLIHPFTGDILFLKQTKNDRVVDELVGLGGKARPITYDFLKQVEKIPSTMALNAALNYQLSSEELVQVACREVMEETSTYAKDLNGNYTHEIVRKGLVVDARRMVEIGLSKVRLILPSKAEAWMISHYAYVLNNEELLFLETIAYQNREGMLEWKSKNEALPFMSCSDRVILKNMNSNVTVSEIRDKVNGSCIVKTKLGLEDKIVHLLSLNGFVPMEYEGVVEKVGTEKFSKEWEEDVRKEISKHASSEQEKNRLAFQLHAYVEKENLENKQSFFMYPEYSYLCASDFEEQKKK